MHELLVNCLFKLAQENVWLHPRLCCCLNTTPEHKHTNTYKSKGTTQIKQPPLSEKTARIEISHVHVLRLKFRTKRTRPNITGAPPPSHTTTSANSHRRHPHPPEQPQDNSHTTITTFTWQQQQANSHSSRQHLHPQNNSHVIRATAT